MASRDNLQETIPAVDRVTQALSAQAAILIELCQAIRAAKADATAIQAKGDQAVKAVVTAVHQLA